MSSWRDDVTALSALYLLIEKRMAAKAKDDGTPQALLLRRMGQSGLVADVDGRWESTNKGEESMRRAIAAQDVLRQAEIFARVDVTRVIGPDETDPKDSRQVRPEIWDPRFAEGNQGFDLRLAVLEWLSDSVGQGKEFSPQKTVFLQRLGAGLVDVHKFWDDQASTFREIEAVTSSAYEIDDLQPGDPAVSRGIMAAVYAAGQLEQQKRDGSCCGGCQVPLLMFEREAEKAGQELSSCPCCARVFPPADGSSGDMACPNCSERVYDGDRQCGGCCALLDFSLPAGTVVTETEAVTETVWSSGYGYVSYGWLDPWDPYADAVFIGGGLYYDPWY